MAVVAIVAGGGQFPVLVAQGAKKKGAQVVVIGLAGQVDRDLASHATVYEEIKLGQLGKLLKLCKELGVEEVVFAGKVRKPASLWDIRPDLQALKLWQRLRSRNDDQLLRAVAEEIEAQGFKVVSPTHYLDDLLTPEGVLTQRAPTKEEEEDIRFGWEMAKAIGRLDIGQCVVVKDRMVVAVEAMEGTDATILRAGDLAKGVVVVKVCKPQQDTRFDLPAAGLQTILSLKQAQGRVLVLEAGRSLFFDREQALALADQAGICVVGLREATE